MKTVKNLEPLVRRVFFYGAFATLVVAVIEKIANLIGSSLIKPYTPQDLLEWAVVALVFSIAMQLHQIRLLLEGKQAEGKK